MLNPYPRNPRGNAYVERFNRTLEEQFIDYREWQLEEDLEGFNRDLMEYLLWYNTERPHSGIEGKAPLEYILNKFLKNQSQSQMVWTYTYLDFLFKLIYTVCMDRLLRIGEASRILGISVSTLRR